MLLIALRKTLPYMKVSPKKMEICVKNLNSLWSLYFFSGTQLYTLPFSNFVQ